MDFGSLVNLKHDTVQDVSWDALHQKKKKISYHLYNLKKREKQIEKRANFSESNTHSWVFFPFSNLHKW